MSVLKKRVTVAAMAATGALLLLAPASHAATSFGSLRTTNDPTQAACNDPMVLAPCTIVQYIVPTNPNGDPYSGGAPVDGVITKFRIRAYGDGGPATVTFRLANISRNDPSSATASSAGTGPTVTVPAGPTSSPTPTTTASGRLPVKKGQQLAIDASQNIVATYDSSGSQFSYAFAPVLVDGQAARTSNNVFGELLVSADIEPDADHDGFGDETQDKCPTDPSTHGACDKTPPKVSGLRVAGAKISYKLSEKAKVRFKLLKATTGRRVAGKCVRRTRHNSTRPHCKLFRRIGAAFSGPGAAGAHKRSLPRVHGRRLGPGLYRLVMTVTDAKGNSATKTRTFRIRR